MVNSKHSVKLNPTPNVDLCSSSSHITGSEATLRTSGTNGDENSFKETVSKICTKKRMKENYSST